MGQDVVGHIASFLPWTYQREIIKDIQFYYYLIYNLNISINLVHKTPFVTHLSTVYVYSHIVPNIKFSVDNVYFYGVKPYRFWILGTPKIYMVNSNHLFDCNEIYYMHTTVQYDFIWRKRKLELDKISSSVVHIQGKFWGLVPGNPKNIKRLYLKDMKVDFLENLKSKTLKYLHLRNCNSKGVPGGIKLKNLETIKLVNSKKVYLITKVLNFYCVKSNLGQIYATELLFINNENLRIDWKNFEDWIRPREPKELILENVENIVEIAQLCAVHLKSKTKIITSKIKEIEIYQTTTKRIKLLSQ